MQYYRRGTTWMSAQQAREYDKRGEITVVEPDKEVVQEAVIEDKKEEISIDEAKKILVEDIVSGKAIEVTQEELDNAELIEAVPMTEVLANEEKQYAKETGTKIKKGSKK